ncbi:hypothetical protein DITRI_Ditri15bG0121100 [Diplodiscus trichospermus]
MDFLVNEMGLLSSLIAKRPRVITQSWEKRIVPRGLFALELLSKGLVEKEFNLNALFGASEELFIEKFVNRYKADAPELLKLYQEKYDLSKNWKAGGTSNSGSTVRRVDSFGDSEDSSSSVEANLEFPKPKKDKKKKNKKKKEKKKKKRKNKKQMVEDHECALEGLKRRSNYDEN